MPKAYFVVEVLVTDPEAYQEYREKISATLDPFGGRFLIRGGGEPKLLEGEPPLGRVIVLEFDTTERATEWYDSPAYQAIKPIRLRTATSRVVLATGV